MLMSITSSRSSRYGKTASTGVSMLSVMPTRMPAPRAFAMTGAGSVDRLVVERDDVEAGLREIVEQALGSLHHEVPVEDAVGHGSQ